VVLQMKYKGPWAHKTEGMVEVERAMLVKKLNQRTDSDKKLHTLNHSLL